MRYRHDTWEGFVVPGRWIYWLIYACVGDLILKSATQQYSFVHMDKMDAVEQGESGRPKKCPRRELPDALDTIEINAEETAESEPVLDVNDDNRAYIQAFDGPAMVAISIVPLAALPALVFVDEAADLAPAPADGAAAPAPADVAASTDANCGPPSANRRRRPRKGVPRRAPLF